MLEALITLDAIRTGKVKRLAVYGKTQQECRDKLIEHCRALRIRHLLSRIKSRVEGWLDAWLKSQKDNIRPTTYSSYEYIVRVHIAEPWKGIFELKPEGQRFYNERKARVVSDSKVYPYCL